MTQPNSPSPGAALPNEGDLIAGKYRIEKLLGKGGMGAVYAAQHEILFQKVALKVLLPEIAGATEAVTRFQNEARAAARIQSEHVARVMDVGTENSMPYMVMEYLEGQDLGKLLEERGPLPVQEVVDSVLEALEAISQAHAMQIVHRDLKPANLFLCRRQDGRSFVKVLDFGISKATNPLAPGSGGMTSTKAMLGSPYYMSPEQLRSSKSVDARTDLWSMGVIMYELLSGTVPYNGENLGELFAAILEQAPAPLRARRPDVPPELELVVMRCLQRTPDQRFASARDLAAALARFASPRGLLAAERIRVSTMNAPGSAPTSPHAASIAAAQPPGVATGPQLAAAQQSSNSHLPVSSVRDPRPGAGTAAAWGNTGPGVPRPSKWPLIVGLASAALLFIGVGSAVAVKVLGKHATQDAAVSASASATASAPPPSVAAAATALPVVATAPAQDAPAPDAGVLAASAPPAAPAAAAARGGHTSRPAGGVKTPSTPPATAVAQTTTTPPAQPAPPAPPAGKDIIPGAGRK